MLPSIKWQERIPDTEVFTRAGLPTVYTMLMKSQHRWAEHIIRMPDYRLPKKLLFGELQEGKHSRGASKKRFKDSSKASLKTFPIDPDS